MITSKVFKYKKLIFCIMLIMGFVIGGTYLYLSHKTGLDYSNSVRTELPISTLIKDSGVIDKNLVIKSLTGTQQLVGMEGHAEKSYTYYDSLFKGHNWLENVVGQRSIEMDTNSFFKMGVNLSDIKSEEIQVYGNSLFIKLPKQILISLDIPFDQIVFKTNTGILRSGLTDVDKQTIYTEIRRLTTENIMSDNVVISKSTIGVQDALRSLLEKIPNLNRIVFKV